MAKVTQTAPQGRTGRRFKCIEPFQFVRNGMVVADYVPGLEYFETTDYVKDDGTVITGNQATISENAGKIQWL